MRCTTPCKGVVLQIAKVKDPINKERHIRVILSELIPKLVGRLKKITILPLLGW
jgi:hypothetical protein